MKIKIKIRTKLLLLILYGFPFFSIFIDKKKKMLSLLYFSHFLSIGDALYFLLRVVDTFSFPG